MKWCWILIFFTLPLTSTAHNLDVETRSENGELVIQVWLGDDPGEQVEIEIFTESSELRHSGQTNQEGIMTWQPILEEILIISVHGEPGHEEEITIPKDTVTSILSGTSVSEKYTHEHDHTHPEMPSTKKNRQSVGNIMAGIGLIIAIAALWMAYRNQQRITILENELNNRER